MIAHWGVHKGFREHEGCYLPNLLLRGIIEDVLHALWIHHMPQAIISVVMDLYAVGTFRVNTTYGYTGYIQLAAVVRQADPLNPILYNPAMTPVVRALKNAAA